MSFKIGQQDARNEPDGHPDNLHFITIFLFFSSAMNSPSTLPPKRLNLPPCFGSKTLGGALVNADTRPTSTNVVNNSSPVVWNSAVSEIVTVFTIESSLTVVEEVDDEVAAFALGGTGDTLCRPVGVPPMPGGPEPGECCISLPCSEIKSLANFPSAFRNWGTISVRIRLLTGSFSLLSE